jgi:type II secretory pathway component PulF
MSTAANTLSGLRALAEELSARRWSRALQSVAQGVERGVPVSAALEAPEVRLPAYVKGLVRSALTSGDLAAVLAQLVSIERSAVQLRRQIRLTLAYPVSLVSVLLVLFICYEHYFIVPLADLYEDFGIRRVTIPNATRVVMGLSQPAAMWTYAGVAAAVAALVLLRWFLRPAWMDRALARVPLVGCLWRWLELSRFCRILALLLQEEIPLPEALRLAATGLRDADLAAGCGRLARRADEGELLSAALMSVRPFPATLRPLVGWGEARSALPEALRTAGDMFERRVKLQRSLVETLVPPLAFLLVAGGVLFMVYAAYAPLYQILSALA